MPKHILMIDDDPDDADFFRDAIADLPGDMIVHYIQEGDQAIQHLLHAKKEEFPDVIFMDISMPAIDGWECLREIKNLIRYKQVPIVMFSTLNFKMQDLAPSDIGAAAFLTKSDSMTGLKTNLASLFGELFPGEPAI